jgi:hypothetical protein
MLEKANRHSTNGIQLTVKLHQQTNRYYALTATMEQRAIYVVLC